MTIATAGSFSYRIFDDCFTAWHIRDYPGRDAPHCAGEDCDLADHLSRLLLADCGRHLTGAECLADNLGIPHSRITDVDL
jgi:hypothetical protein